jgi:nitrogen-specific signal transduction histidine kinase
MKWLSNRYAYPLVIFAIVVSIALQLAWLSQLFRAQRVQVKLDLEQIVGNAAKLNSYLSIVPGHERSDNFKQFFLSAEWLQFRQSFTNMRFHQIGVRFNSEFVGDSTFVDISLRVSNNIAKRRHHAHVTRFDENETLEHAKAVDKIDAKRMDSLVNSQLGNQGIKFTAFTRVVNYEEDVFAEQKERKSVSNSSFVSQQYAYNFKFLNTFQLVVPSVNTLVIYRMRYYMLSSCFMLLLTVAVFFFILRLMHNQRLYAQARVSFTSNMTHELKTPVSTVAIALESIIENHLENDPKTLRNYLEISRSELKRLNLMIDKVLNLEHLDNGQEKLRHELFDVQQGLEQVIASMRLQIQNSAATLNWEPFKDPCFVTGDPVHLINVFYNLIENALKYGGWGVALTISCERNSREVIISFKDNGPGIESIYQSRVFDRFFRVPAGKADVHNVKGTGLGLNYVKQMIEKHGGSIRLISEPGTGSNFIVHLPVVS